MQTTKPTTASLVYATVISNPGVTSRELKGLLRECPATAINGALATMVRRGALVLDTTDGERSGKYSKGKAPVVLRNAYSTKPSNDMTAQTIKQEIVQAQQLLSSLLGKLEKIQG